MPKFTRGQTVVKSPVQTVTTAPDTVTHEGGSGWSRDAKSELFLLAVTNMVSEKTFYETGTERDERFETLIHQVTQEDPDWIRRFVPYLRDTMNMRAASIVMAAEYVKAGGPKGRSVVSAACVRADEPQEMLGYWLSRYGRKLPQPVKRGLADAAIRLYSERNVIKYGGGDTKTVRMADVLELAHPEPKAEWQSHLFKYLLDSRHNRDIGWEGMPLGMLKLNVSLMGMEQDKFKELFDTSMVEASGLTWEQASSKYGKLDAHFWEVMAPNMGIFAVVRNLRNFDDAGIAPATATVVHNKLTDADVIAKSRMFPFRFYAAYKELATLNWASPLETAIGLSLQNVPSLKGRTLILVDVSGSMSDTMSGRSKLRRKEAAALFGAALALRAEKADLVAYDDSSYDIPFRKVGSILRLVENIVPQGGGGTNTWQAVAKHVTKEHARVIILTDEQAHYYGAGIPVQAHGNPIYVFNLAGYKAAMAPSSGSLHTFGGLSDAGFTLLDILEKRRSADWPF